LQVPPIVRSALDRYRELRGREEAAAITLYGLFALFALMVLAIAVLGFASASDEEVAHRIAEGMGLHGSAADLVVESVTRAQDTRAATTVIGLVGLIWVGSSLAVTVASAYDHAWGVEQRFARARLIGLLWLLGAGVLLAVGAVLTGVLSSLPWLAVPVVLAASLAVNTVLWLWTSWILPNRKVPLRPLLPAALFGAVALEILKVVGVYVVPRLVSKSSALYGTIGVVFALIAWLWVFGRVVVFVTIIEALPGAVTRRRGQPTVNEQARSSRPPWPRSRRR
jgi:membrane protein